MPNVSYLRTESVVHVKQILQSFTRDLDFQLNEIH